MLEDIVKITENEYIGDLMKRTIVIVDLSTSGAVITLYRITNGYPFKIASGIGRLNNPNNLISDNTTYYAVVENGEKHTDFTIDLTAVKPDVQTASTVSTTSAKSKTTATTKE